MQCSTVVAWSKPGLDPCEIKKKGLPFQLKSIKHSQALSNMIGHRMQFLKGPNNVSWSMIGYNTVFEKTIKLPKGHEKCDNDEPNLDTAERAKTCFNHRKKWKNFSEEAQPVGRIRTMRPWSSYHWGDVGEHLIKELKMPSCKIFVTRFQMRYTLPRKHVGRFWPLKKPGGIYEEAQPVSSPRTWR